MRIFARVAQLEEQRPSKAKVTGSSPVSRTISKDINIYYGWLAQLVRAPALQAGGRRFESYKAHFILKASQFCEAFFYVFF